MGSLLHCASLEWFTVEPMQHEDLPVTCSTSTLKAPFFERAFNLTWVPCISNALRRFRH